MPLRVTSPQPIPSTAARGLHCILPIFRPQQESQWCWAACAEMALARWQINRSQHQIAIAQFPSRSCQVSRGPCNDPLNDTAITTLLKREGLTRTRYDNQPITLDAVLRELAEERPVQVGITVGDGDGERGHVILVCGRNDHSPDNPHLTVSDPKREALRDVPWLALKRGYEAGYRWDATWTELR
jgi:hypothetical protein